MTLHLPAKEIRVERTGPTGRIFIDGTEIPWAIARESIDVRVHPDEEGSVRFTLLAERVLVDDQVHPANPSEETQ